ncbi:hypothetical protein B7494_g1054 [Chlorociboria aeruginascens]|nr:hypothetical protein B7494_g1054 [Chlorociboria aeruginascens]
MAVVDVEYLGSPSTHLHEPTVSESDLLERIRRSSIIIMAFTSYISANSPVPQTSKSRSEDASSKPFLLEDVARAPRRISSLRKYATLSDLHAHLNHRRGSLFGNVGGDPCRRLDQSSNTWTSISGDAPNHGDSEDCTVFVEEYNKLAEKHRMRKLQPDNWEPDYYEHGHDKSGSWFSRKVLRRTSSSHNATTKLDRQLKHKRSFSDSLRLKLKRDAFKDKDVKELVRLCGSSLLHLPSDYALASLAVPTCFRATAQYLIQHGPVTRGVFRIPGSRNIVNALYNHYTYNEVDEDGSTITGTVHCPTLPEHIRCDVHDVASAFKRFLAGLPCGILGSLALFDALVSISSQLHADPEMTRTRQTKVRARLIALAILSLNSQYRRNLICAVFGLLSMIGRVAETSRREDDHGRPLPTSDLMGYRPLGIVFGPLLIGEQLDNYIMQLVNPYGGLVLFPVASQPKVRKEKQKKSKSGDDIDSFNTHVEKIKVANGITEMLITHWRDVVRHMKNIKRLKSIEGHRKLAVRSPKQTHLRPSTSEFFSLRKPPDWDNGMSPSRNTERSISPTPAQRKGSTSSTEILSAIRHTAQEENLAVRKQRARPRPMSSQNLSRTISMTILSPTAEEHLEAAPRLEMLSPDSLDSEPPQNTTITNAPNTRQHLESSSQNTPVDTLKNNFRKNPKSYYKNSYESSKNNSQSSGSHSSTLQDENHVKDTEVGRSTSLEVSQKDILSISGLANPPSPNPLLSEHAQQITASDQRGAACLPKLNPRTMMSTSKIARWKDCTGPLARISHEQDIISSTDFAKAIKPESTNPEVSLHHLNHENVSVKPAPFMNPSEESVLKMEICVSVLDYTERPENHYHESPKSRSAKDSPTKPPCSSESTSSITQHSLLSPQDDTNYRNTLTEALSNTKIIATQSKRLPRYHSFANGVDRNSIGGSVKAMAAKFDNADISSTYTPSPSKTTMKLIPRSSKKSLSGIDGAVSESPKPSQVSTYTTNPSPSPSPTKSQKSDISLYYQHPSLPFAEQLKSRESESLKRFTPPRRILRSSIKDTTPLRLIRTPLYEPAGSSKASPSTFHDLERTLEPIESPLRRDASTLQSFDSPHVLRGNSASQQSPVITHSHLSTNDSAAASGSGSPIASPGHQRCSSILHLQIRALQRQLTAKNEEIQQLARQLDVREKLDTVALSEQLREAKREIEFWRNKAEVSEKRVLRIDDFSSSSGTHACPSNSIGPVDTSNHGSGEDRAVVADRTRRNLHGLDGAESRQHTSNESSRTVIHDVEEAANGRDYSIWIKQMMKTFDSAESHEVAKQIEEQLRDCHWDVDEAIVDEVVVKRNRRRLKTPEMVRWTKEGVAKR